MEKKLKKLQPLFLKFSQQQEEAQQTVSAIVSLLHLIETEFPCLQAEESLPEYFSAQEVANYLGIHTSNFYRNVHEKLLFPALKIGRRTYYLQNDVRNLFTVHETGAHTYSKKKKKHRKKCQMSCRM